MEKAYVPFLICKYNMICFCQDEIEGDGVRYFSLAAMTSEYGSCAMMYASPLLFGELEPSEEQTKPFAGD